MNRATPRLNVGAEKLGVRSKTMLRQLGSWTRQGAAVGVLLAASLSCRDAAAQHLSPPPPNPPGWVSVKTLGFRMALPGDYQEFYTFKKDPLNNPHLGNWGFTSPHATRKVFVRVSVLKKGTAQQLLEKTVVHLKRKAGEVERLKYIEIPKDEEGRDGVIGFYKGVMHAKSHKTGKLGEYHHLIIRGILRYSKYNTQVTLTHMVRGDRTEGAEDFFLKQAETFQLRNPAEAKKLAAPLIKELKAAKAKAKALTAARAKAKAEAAQKAQSSEKPAE